MQVKFVVAAGYVGEAAKTIFAPRAVSEIVGVVADIDVNSGLHRVLPQNFGEGVSKLVAPVGIGKLEAVPAEHEAGVGILNRDRG